MQFDRHTLVLLVRRDQPELCLKPEEQRRLDPDVVRLALCVRFLRYPLNLAR
jgi:hypothetical protein